MDAAFAAFGEALAGIANTFSQQVLSRNDALMTQVAQCEGICIEFVCQFPPAESQMSVRDGQLHFAHGAAQDPTATICGAAPQLMAWLFGTDSADVIITGDEIEADKLRTALKALTPDPSAAISDILGEDVIRTVSGIAESSLKAVQAALADVTGRKGGR